VPITLSAQVRRRVGIRGYATQAVASADGEVRDRGWIGDRIGQWLQRAGVRDAAVGSVSVVVLFVLSQRLQ
jgi:hypothetical protein